MAEKKNTVKDSGSEMPGPEETAEKECRDEATEKAKAVSCKKEIKESEKVIEELQLELAAEKDRVLRLSAEFDNYKKRSAREAEDFRKFANEALFKQLLTVVDNLERAISSATETEASESILEGVKLTHREMIKFFNTFNVKALEANGKQFDPAFHQAVTQQESDEHPDNTVIMELQKGYLLHDRLIRPSMVVVSKAGTKQEKQNN